jgi:RNA polymerase sigma-70 factor (ECF subfamily)
LRGNWDISSGSALELEAMLARWSHGDTAARDALIAASLQRLRRLARRMLRRFPGLGGCGEDTDDVLQGAFQRLLRALREVRPTRADQFLGLCSELIRRELIDLWRHHSGKGRDSGKRYRQASRSRSGELAPWDRSSDRRRPSARASDPAALLERAELHELVDALPPDLRQVVDLLCYQGLSSREAAAVTGLNERTIRRRWREARLRLHERLRGPAKPPPSQPQR